MQNKWVAMWGNAMSIAEHRPESYAKNITLRYPMDAPFDAEQLRFTFDNYCGSESVTITRATAAIADPAGNPWKSLACPVLEDTITDITFGGKPECTLGKGQTAVSDAAALKVSAGDTLCVSFYLADFTAMESAVLVTGPKSKGYFSLCDGTHTPSLDPEITKTTNWFYFLSTVEALTEPKNRAIVCYGDSITAQDWPDFLKLRLAELGLSHTAVIRRAASGTRILRQYSCITYDSYGLKGDNRFTHELPVSGADSVIIQQGINDIIHPVGSDVNIFRPMSDLPTAEELIAGLEKYIRQAKEMGLKVYLGTLLPICGWRTYAPFREELRKAVNDWMRSTSLADGCIDFDRALLDEAKPEAFRPEYDSGDHLHPSSLAYRAMAEAVPEDILK